MRLKLGRGLPDHYRRAIRLAIACGCLTGIGFSFIGVPGYEGLVLALKWAALTCPVVTMPLLGKTAQVGAERLLGTVLGGTLGYVAAAAATHNWTMVSERGARAP